jgi:hypothetical protein
MIDDNRLCAVRIIPDHDCDPAVGVIMFVIIRDHA